MKCYKVLYRDWDDRLWSIGRSFKHSHDLVIEYMPGKKIMAPEGTGLFVFDNYDNALCFVERSHPTRNDRVEIWEVDAKHVTKPIKQVAHIYAYKKLVQSKDLRHRIRNYWHYIKCDRFVKYHLVPAPIGTLACESVVLKRKVS